MKVQQAMAFVENAVDGMNRETLEAAAASLAAEVRRLRDEVNGLTGSLDRAEAALKEARKQEPVAWMHDKEGRVDTCHDSVKKLWLKVGQKQNTQFMREIVPCRVEHYNIPLYTRPIPAPASYLLEGRRFKISINGEGGFYGFEGFPELNGQWVALVDATDNQHMQSAPAAPALNTSSVGSDFDDLLCEDGTLEQCEKIANERGIMSPVNACHFRDHCRKLVQAPTPAVPEEWRNIVTEMVGWWDDQHMTLTQGKAIREKARALLQSAPAAPRKYHEFATVMLDAQPFITAETYGGRYIVAMRFERLGKMQDCHAALLALLQSAGGGK